MYLRSARVRANRLLHPRGWSGDKGSPLCRTYRRLVCVRTSTILRRGSGRALVDGVELNGDGPDLEDDRLEGPRAFRHGSRSPERRRPRASHDLQALLHFGLRVGARASTSCHTASIMTADSRQPTALRFGASISYPTRCRTASSPLKQTIRHVLEPRTTFLVRTPG
jgi:hypothetical protein